MMLWGCLWQALQLLVIMLGDWGAVRHGCGSGHHGAGGNDRLKCCRPNDGANSYPQQGCATTAML